MTVSMKDVLKHRRVALVAFAAIFTMALVPYGVHAMWPDKSDTFVATQADPCYDLKAAVLTDKAFPVALTLTLYTNDPHNTCHYPPALIDDQVLLVSDKKLMVELWAAYDISPFESMMYVSDFREKYGYSERDIYNEQINLDSEN